MAVTRRIGILGGSFDPPHRAHVALATLFTERLALTELRIIPAGRPWQKHALHAENKDRVAMVELAMDDARIACRIDQREIHRSGPSYTEDTLREIRAEEGNSACLIFLMGADQLMGLPSWHGWPDLLNLANFAAAGRPGSALEMAFWPKELAAEVKARLAAPEALQRPAGQIALIPADLGDLSSSRVRELLRSKDQRDLADLVPSNVLDYIRQRGLYIS